ncbi:hypothetical protein [Paraclostridium bifermentans]|uniref:hypothetical protein n=1 Tax=Paraclostridium bifermentans TaxID=1490 RepID=UPI00241D3E51|nr:hypothetical protein [Paraclostridium bifermentans]
MKNIKRLVKQFRDAIDVARDKGNFDNDFSFSKFPRGCCGDTSDLLAQFLLENSIRTYYVCGMCRGQSHAWLLTYNNSIIIDITGDQFKDNSDFLNYEKSVYIGFEDDFHRLFKVESMNIRENIGLDALGGTCQPRLNKLYNKIVKYIQ